MEETRYDNTDHGLDETRLERVDSNEYGGDMGYNQNGARAHRKLLVTDSKSDQKL